MTTDAVRRLATVVSLAARIEPELLRAARLRLLPDLDASAEGDLWFSDLVASRSARRVILDSQAASSLRESLAGDPAMLNAARAVVAETHANAPPAIQLEEEILYLALTGADVADAINTKLTSVLSAIANEGRRGLVDWAARALPAMPAVARNTPTAAALRLIAGGQTSDAVYVSRDPALAALVDRALPKTKLFARLVPREPGGTCIEISRTELPASHEIELPKTEPLVVELTTLGRTEVLEVPREGTLLREMEGAVSIRTIARDVFRLEEVREGERVTVRILVMTRLAMRELILPDEPDIDVVLISDVPEWAADQSDYIRIADRLRDRFGDVPILAAPGETDRRNILGFEAFRARVGFTSDRSEFGKTLSFSRGTLAIVGIDNVSFGEDYPFGNFSAAQVSNACGGDPLGWALQHDVAILLMSHNPERLTPESLQKWEAFGAEDVFDLIIDGANVPRQTQGFTLIEVNLSSRVITSATHREDRIEKGDPTHARPRGSSPETAVECHRVLIAGIAEGLSLRTQELSRAIGSLLALQGHDLITGGWPGVDYLSSEGFDKAAPNRVESITHYFGGLRKEPDYKRGRAVFFEREQDALRQAVTDADVVILIEGASGTRSVGIEAISQGKPVIPIGGGAAAELRDTAIRPGRWAEHTIDRLRRLGGQASVATIIHDVNELIRVARPLDRDPSHDSKPRKIVRTEDDPPARREITNSSVNIVLVHGVLGFGHTLPGFPNYFNEVKHFLERRFPGLKVLEPSMSPTDSVRARAAELGGFIRGFGQHVHIIAHSTSGLDARMAVHDLAVAPHVRSITTIGTPHAGSEVADAIVEGRGPLVGRIPKPIVAFLELVGPALHDLTTTNVPQIADVASIRYREIAGDAARSNHASLLFRFAAEYGRLVGANDGVVTVASATRPERALFATWPFDHAGEIGWSLDALPLPFADTSHLARYEDLVNGL